MRSTHRYFQRISRWICIFLQCITLTKTKKSLSVYQEIARVTATMCRGKTALWLLSTFTEVEILKQNTKCSIFEMWLTDLSVSIRYSRYSYRYEMQIQCGSGHRDGTAFGCWWTQSLVYLQKSVDYCSNYLRQSHCFLYGLTFSPHANRFLGQQNVFLVDWRGVSSPLVTHYLLCAVFVRVTSPPRLQPINGRRNQNSTAFETFQKDFWTFFFVLWASSQMHICFPTMQRRRGAAFFPFGELIFWETLASRPSPLSFCTYDFLLCCARLSSLLPACRNFFPFSPGFWLADVHWCGHTWLFLKHCWHAFNWWLRNLWF